MPTPKKISSPDLELHIDTLVVETTTALTPTRTRWDLLRIEALQQIGHIYQVLVPYLSAASLLALIFLAFRSIRQRVEPTPPVILLATLALFFSRLGLMAFMNLTAFDGTTSIYLAPAHVLLVTFIILSLSLTAEKA